MLSENAVKRRREDMIAIEGRISPYQFARILAIGFYLLVRGMAEKMTPKQRFVLILLVSVSGGTLIFLFIHAQMIGFALLIMFVIGWLLNEIGHLK